MTDSYYVVENGSGTYLTSDNKTTSSIFLAYRFLSLGTASTVSFYIPGSVVRTLTLTVT